MQEKFTFEYAIIRVVPRVEREEFLNVGVIVFCKRPAFLEMKYVLDESRLLALYSKTDIEDVRQHLQAFEQISKGNKMLAPLRCSTMLQGFVGLRQNVAQLCKHQQCIRVYVTIQKKRWRNSLNN